jgi:hypothetical protein
MGVIIAENASSSFIRIEFERGDDSPMTVKLMVKSNIGTSDDGVKQMRGDTAASRIGGATGIGGAPRDMPKKGQELMAALIVSLRRRNITAIRTPVPPLESGEDPPAQHSAFFLSATIDTLRTDSNLAATLQEVIAEAEQQVGLQNYGTTSDKAGGEQAGSPHSRL